MAEKLKRLFSKNRAYIIYALCCVLIFALIFMLLKFPDIAAQGVREGIELCICTLIPSLYPFMFAVNLMISLGIPERLGRVFRFICKRIFGLSALCGPVIILSMVGGLPLGAVMTQELYKRGEITEGEGRRLLLFCINPGPAFVVSAVGVQMLSSARAGIIIYCSLVASSLITGIASRVIGEKQVYSELLPRIKFGEFRGEEPIKAVANASRTMLTVCGWVILFSCLTKLLERLIAKEGIRLFVIALCEITKGCRQCSGVYPLPLISGIIGFSGACAFMQILPAIIRLRLSFKYFITARIINGALAVFISSILFELFPVAVEAALIGETPERAATGMPLPISVGVFIMLILSILGDSFTIKKRPGPTGRT